jgi:hypothetical protein
VFFNSSDENEIDPAPMLLYLGSDLTLRSFDSKCFPISGQELDFFCVCSSLHGA